MSHALKLFVSPGTCARVPTIALEEIGVPFETELVRLKIGQQKSPAYLAINPKGKVPALLIDGQPLTENVAILQWLHRAYPDARLLPNAENALTTAQQTADLAFFSGTIHPFVTRYARPDKFIEDAARLDEIRAHSVTSAAPFWTMIDERLAGQPWWYGDQWSIIDGYLFWTWTRTGASGFDGSAYTHITDHTRRMLERDTVARAMEREKVLIDQLKAEGLYVAPS